MRSIFYTSVIALSLTMGGCSATQSVRIQNETSDDIVVRVVSDHWMEAYSCGSGELLGGFNSEGTYPVDQGDGLCLIADEPKGEDDWDMRVHVRNLTLVRQGERCMYATGSSLLEEYSEAAGRHLLEVTNGMCMSPAAREAMEDGEMIRHRR